MKFKCSRCNREIVIRFLESGDKAKCKNCGEICTVPSYTETAGIEAETAGKRSTENATSAATVETTERAENRVDKNIIVYRILGLNFVAGAIFGLFSMFQLVFSGQLGENQPLFVALATVAFLWYLRIGVHTLERRTLCLEKVKTGFLFLVSDSKFHKLPTQL